MDCMSWTKYHFLSQLSAYDGGTMYGLVESTTDVDENKYRKAFWMGNEGGLTKVCDDWDYTGYYWLNGSTMLWTKKDGTIDKVDLSGKVVDTIKTDLAIESILATPSGLLVGYEKHLNNETSAGGAQLGKDYEKLDEYPFFFNGEGFISGTRHTLAFVKDDGSTTPLLDDGYTVDSYDLLDAHTVIFVGFKMDKVLWKYRQLFTLDLNTGEVNCVYDRKDADISKVFVLDGVVYAMVNFGKDYGAMEQPKIYTFNDGKFTFVVDAFYSLRNSVGSDCRLGKQISTQKINGSMYFLMTKVDTSVLVRFNGSTIEEVAKTNGSIDGYTYVNNHLVTIAMKDTTLQEVYNVENDTFTCISDFNHDVLNGEYVAIPQPLSVPFGSESVEGWVLLPKDFDGSTTYPAILQIHGGPKTAYGTTFFHEMQLMANNGYIVMFCNPHGSDGKGDAFADLRQKWGTIDYDQLMAFVDGVLAKYPNIDRNRLGVAGGSYGGYMTNWIIGHTHRFAAACSQRSISNWISEVMASDYGYDFPVEQQYGNIYACEKELWEMSPLKYVNFATTPTLFIHSEQDYRCPVAEGYQMMTGLMLNKIPTTMYLFHGENHELSRSGSPKNRIKRLEAIMNWFDQYLK